MTLTDDALTDYRTGHPLHAVLPVLRDLVGDTAEDGQHLWALADAGGRLMWVEGHRSARSKAARMNFVEGAEWAEAHAGTNAPGTALALDHPVQIFATEHFRHTVQDWTCAAAPIHDPATGELLGVLDVTGGDAVAHPHSLALVRAAARAAEAQLPWRRAGELWLPSTPEPARLRVLGHGDGMLQCDGREIRLHRRHAEILVLLAASPDGLTGEQLADALYDEGVPVSTVRAELNRLRRVVGELVRSRPYRLARPVEADHVEVAGLLRRGDVATAVARYPGPLLPGSEAPGIVSQRRWLELQLRSAVLAADDDDILYAWASGSGFDDLAVWERLAQRCSASSPRRGVALSRARQLRSEYGLDATLRQRHPT